MSAERGSLGRALRYLRTSRGLSAKKLADASAIAPSLLSQYEHGGIKPGYASLSKLLRAMNYKHGAIDRAQEFDLGLEDVETGEGAW
jgi:transcriptional regulator with XRE-family HTH domain